jgi:hypothetical protein
MGNPLRYLGIGNMPALLRIGIHFKHKPHTPIISNIYMIVIVGVRKSSKIEFSETVTQFDDLCKKDVGCLHGGFFFRICRLIIGLHLTTHSATKKYLGEKNISMPSFLANNFMAVN